MKIRITLKDPDGFWDSITDAIESELSKVEGITQDEKDQMVESRREDTFELLNKWVKYNEYVVVVFDTDKQTATVIENGN